MNLNFVFFFIEGNETFEKLASMSLIANLVVYMHTQYNMDTTFSVEVFNIWSGFTNFLPLVAAYVADAYAGKFNMLFLGSIASFLVNIKKHNQNIVNIVFFFFFAICRRIRDYFLFYNMLYFVFIFLKSLQNSKKRILYSI